MSYNDARSRKLPASAGIDWFLQGLKAARMAPVSMLGVVLFYLLGSQEKCPPTPSSKNCGIQ